MRRLSLLSLAVVCAPLVACSSSDASGPPATTTDSGYDGPYADVYTGRPDDGTDSGVDSAADAPTDSPTDSAKDVATDTAVEASTDADAKADADAADGG